jgi:hypothetical protein
LTRRTALGARVFGSSGQERSGEVFQPPVTPSVSNKSMKSSKPTEQCVSSLPALCPIS